MQSGSRLSVWMFLVLVCLCGLKATDNELSTDGRYLSVSDCQVNILLISASFIRINVQTSDSKQFETVQQGLD